MNQAPSRERLAWLSGGGPMAESIRHFDWATTPLGPLESWPSSLTTMVGVMLHSRQPMFLWWGAELIQIYNDAYVPSFGVGKHPKALGQRGRECWQEIWPIIGPQIDDVRLRAKACWFEDALVPILRNGKIEDVYWTYGYSPVFDEAGQIAGVLVICSETTSRVEAIAAKDAARARVEHELRTLAENAEQASRAKDEFLITASHELRTPLSAILGWARLMRAGQLEPSAHLRAVETIERNAKAQVRLIEDILDGSRIITGKLRLEIRRVDLSVLVQAALEAVRPAAEAKGISLSSELDPNAARVIGDPERLQQVVWNLCNNAIKFTPKGGAVTVRLQRVDTDIELEVRDSGQGIEPDFLPHVFERFRQAEGSTTRRYGGLGLGLALVRHLVEAHGGSVRAESAGVGLGATFKARFPVQAVFSAAELDSVRPSPLPSIDPYAAAVDLTGVTVLVVDDEVDARELVATVLRGNGAVVTIATSASDALHQLSTFTPMVLLSDVGLPVMDGYALIRRVRAEVPEGAALPAIALTAYAREEDRRLAISAGFNHHVAKPVEPAELLRIVAAAAAESPRKAEALALETGQARADAHGKLTRLLRTGGIHAMLRLLNDRTPHRYTALYRFDGETLRSLNLFDAESPDMRQGEDLPVIDSYCSIVRETERTFTTADSRRDDRLRNHPARERLISYCGVLVRSADDTPYGSLCHFDVVPCDIPSAEMPFMEAAARLLTQHLPA